MFSEASALPLIHGCSFNYPKETEKSWMMYKSVMFLQDSDKVS